MGLAKAIKRGASALLIGSMMTGLFTGCSATGENSGGKLVKIASRTGIGRCVQTDGGRGDRWTL